MALIRFTVGTDAAGKPTISPDPKTIEFRPNDYVLFETDPAKGPPVKVHVEMDLDKGLFGIVTASRLELVLGAAFEGGGAAVVTFSSPGGGDPQPPFPSGPGAVT